MYQSSRYTHLAASRFVRDDGPSIQKLMHNFFQESLGVERGYSLEQGDETAANSDEILKSMAFKIKIMYDRAQFDNDGLFFKVSSIQTFAPPPSKLCTIDQFVKVNLSGP